MANLFEPVMARNGQRFLLLDTCGSAASVAIAQGDELLEQRILPGRSASEGLTDAIREVLQRRTWHVQDLNAFVVVRGPGSFTGIRVGVCTAKALAEASGRPLIAVSRLEVLATRVSNAAIVVLEAGRDEVFWAPVQERKAGKQEIAARAWVIDHSRMLNLPVWGETNDPGKAAFADFHETPTLTAADALPLAADRLQRGQTDDPLLLDGLYLHKTEQEILARQRAHQSGSVLRAARP